MRRFGDASLRLLARWWSAGCLAALLLVARPVAAASPAEWSSRAIYQIVTDRFALSTNSTAPCGDWHSYCGGTFQGIIDHLDYIQDLGFDAIWISPVVANQPDEYHGYAASNLYQINPHFGGEAGLKALSDALHERQMLLMVDVVANHMGIPPNYDYSAVVPFDSPSHYHSCSGCPQTPGEECFIEDWSSTAYARQQQRLCRLDGLPDLNQTAPFVRTTLLDWVRDLVSNYSIDGLRVDTVAEVSKPFWRDFHQAAGVYAVGEVFDGNVSWVASFQGASVLPATLSYPLFFTLQSAFASDGSGSLAALGDMLEQYADAFEAPALLGTFLENHDNPRFLYGNPSVQAYRSALLFAMYTIGIPISLYGAETLLAGGDDPDNREPLWPYGYSQSTEQYEWLQTIMQYRRQANVASFDQVEQISDSAVYAFSRGTVFVAVTNDASQTQRRAVDPALSPYEAGDTICNVFWPQADCIVVGSEGAWTLVLNDGEQKIFDLKEKAQAERPWLKTTRRKVGLVALK